MQKFVVHDDPSQLLIVEGSVPIRSEPAKKVEERAERARRAFADWLAWSFPDLRDIDLAAAGGEFIAAVAELVVNARPKHERGVRADDVDEIIPRKSARKKGGKPAMIVLSGRGNRHSDGPTRIAFLLRRGGFNWKDVYRFVIAGYDDMPRSMRSMFTQPLRARVTAKFHKAAKRSRALSPEELIEITAWLISSHTEKQ